MRVERVLEFHDLFTEESDLDVRSVLRNYNRVDLVKAVSIIGINYGTAYFPDSEKTLFSKESREFLYDLNLRIKKHLSAEQLNRVCYLTPYTALALMRYVFSIPVEEYINTQSKNLEYDLFRAILQVNHEIMGVDMTDDMELEKLSYVVFYLTNESAYSDLSLLLRQGIFYQKLQLFLKTNAGLETKLLESTGINSLSHYSRIILSLFTVVVKFQTDICYGLCSYNPSVNMLNDKALEFISISINDYVPYEDSEAKNDGNVDYRMFRSHPIIKIDEECYIPFNAAILCERLYNSLVFDVKDAYVEVNERQNFFQYFNSRFVEKRLFQEQMLNCVRPKSFFSPSSKEIYSQDNQTEKDFQPDFYIREGKNLILFECKSIKISGAIKDGADVEKLFFTLRNRLFLSEYDERTSQKKPKAERVGVTQLVHHIKSIQNDEFAFDEKIPHAVRYYPVLVLDDYRMVVPGLAAVVNGWYQVYMEETLPEVDCLPLVVMSIDMLYLYEDLFKRLSFHQIIDCFIKKAVQYDESVRKWRMESSADFNQFLFEQYPQKKSRYKRLWQSIFGEMVSV